MHISKDAQRGTLFKDGCRLVLQRFLRVGLRADGSPLFFPPVDFVLFLMAAGPSSPSSVAAVPETASPGSRDWKAKYVFSR